MKQRHAAFALGFLVLALALGGVLVKRHFLRSTSNSGNAAARRAVPPVPKLSASNTPPPPAVPAPASRLRPPYLDTDAKTLSEQRDALFTNMKDQLTLKPGALEKVEKIFEGSKLLSQGDPRITKHPMTRAECRAIRSEHVNEHPADPRCGDDNMVTIYDPAKGETADNASVCIDQFEYPNIPCEYPVVWVRANEAAELCEADGKRLCDAHEWEGACAGALHTPDVDYNFGQRRLMQEYLHNKTRELIWAYGPKADQKKCGTMSHKSKECYTPDWGICGSNTYPTGSFPECVSKFGVYDQHGNAAEHMNLPLKADELGKNGGTGETEMKGSWFIFASDAVYPDDCRWRALEWHVGRIRAADSHRNYHLGFRCCKDIQPSEPPPISQPAVSPAPDAGSQP